MKFLNPVTEDDLKIVQTRLAGFLPEEIYDIHTHSYDPAHFAPDAWKPFQPMGKSGVLSHRAHLQQYMSSKTIHGLYFGMPVRSADRPAINQWVAEEVQTHGTTLSRALLLVSPDDSPVAVAEALRSGRYVGLKVYHCYADRPDTMNARVEEYAPEWMWEILHEVKGLLMLHIVRDGAIADPDNQRDLRRLCRTYPNAKLVLAHVARSFNYRNGKDGMHAIADLDNAVIDTSAVCEAEAFKAAMDILGPRRILWGSDFAVSELRGRCVTTGDLFYWIYADSAKDRPTRTEFPLVGIESLLTLREAAEDSGLTQGELEDIFLNNALRTLASFLPADAVPESADGTALWKRAREVISGGTGLLSKRAEMFDARSWPSYFSKAKGCTVWDTNGRRYLDFAGGIGAVVLGYADPDVNAAVRRRVAQGSYCSLVNPQEIVLAEKVLGLHPWAGKVRFARGGGDAMTMAVRIARAATGRSGIAFCGYHGWHDWYLAANLGDTDALNGHLLPGLNPKGVPRELAGTSIPFTYNDLDSLDAAIARHGANLAAVVMEPMRSQWPKDDFLAKAAARCRAAGAVFVIDEITSGLRYGFPGALSRVGVEPDLVAYAKAISNGYPFGMVVGRETVMAGANESFISSSYWTDGIGSAAALATLEKVERLGVSEIIWQRGERLQGSLREVAARHPVCRLEIGGMPASPSVVFGLGEDAPLAKALYVRKMAERGFLVGGYSYLMLAHEDAVIDQFVEAVNQVLGELTWIIERGCLETEAGVPRKDAGFVRLA